ncbi:MAG: phage integrase SAM-like domain-containing protein [Ginsengibacter sp.]
MATVLPIKAICNSYKKRDGTNLISIQYCESPTKRTVLPTNIYIPREYWNSKQRIILNTLPISFGDAKKLNLYLNKEIRRAEEIVLLANETNCNSPIEILRKFHVSNLTIEEITNEVKVMVMKDGNLKTGPNLDIYFQIDDYVQSKIKKVSKGMASVYRNMKEHLLEFEAFRGKPITFECLDLTFYEEFVDFLMFEYIQRRRKEKIIGLKVNTVGKTNKQFRTFLRNRIRKRIIPPIDMDGWKILEEEVDAVKAQKQKLRVFDKNNSALFL